MEVNDIRGSLSDSHHRIVRTSEPRYKKTRRGCAPSFYSQIKDEDWSLAGASIGLAWPYRLWSSTKPYQCG
ncbi:hypothetical protein ACVILK_003828 [Bradyrhizobium embrapense]